MRIKFISFLIVIVSSCSVEKRLNKSADAIFNTTAFKAAHLGVSIFEPSTSKRWYDYQGDKYFVPASNTKIPTCYAAMKYLGDSLTGIQIIPTAHTLLVNPSGDPTFLHPDFRNHPVLDFLQRTGKEIIINTLGWKSSSLGSGWSWNDFQEYYMTERSLMPAYGNVVNFSGRINAITATPNIVIDTIEFFQNASDSFLVNVSRELKTNKFKFIYGATNAGVLTTTFDTKNGMIIGKILEEVLKKNVSVRPVIIPRPFKLSGYPKIKTQPVDSVLKLMMHRSDNFFAEQSLMMISSELLGIMDDSGIIDSLLKTDFKDLPQKPRWVDGSGLSRYNLFTPRDMVFILEKMKKEFGMKRISEIFPTGNEGTLTEYYVSDSGYIYAKTGTLSGVVALSGFLKTRKNRELIFSVLVNNHRSSATEIRRSIEKFIKNIRENY